VGHLAALLVSVALSPSLHTLPTPLPPHAVLTAPPPPPVVDAVTYALHDADTDAELWSVGGDTRRAMASVTKAMTALLVTESAAPEDEVVISATAANTGLGYVGQPQLVQGERWTVGELVDFMMVQSGNDTSTALAEHVAGSVGEFADLMNARAAELGLEDTSYRNPHGLDQSEHYQSARDLVQVGMAYIQSDWLTRTSRIKYLTFSPPGRELFIRNTNRLIGVFPGMFGIKTGDTANARQVLLAYVDTGSRRYLSAVMGASSHIEATKRLMAWAMTSGGPRDHLLAGVVGSPEEALLPVHEAPRLAAAGEVPDGSSTAGATTPTEERVVVGLAELLPLVLGGTQ
jgi:D-alanyl-D-alanine carboxypeptidase (penicillin-binding protein 5/6)